MVQLTTLADIVQREIASYHTHLSIGAVTYPLLDQEHSIFAVIAVPNEPEDRPAFPVVMAQVIGDKVVILEDTTDKPLYRALMINGGIPREQIILAYAGETRPAQGDSPTTTH